MTNIVETLQKALQMEREIAGHLINNLQPQIFTELQEARRYTDELVRNLTCAEHDATPCDEALTEALAALEPLAALAQAYPNYPLEDRRIITAVCIEARPAKLRNWIDITLGDARRAAEVLEKVR